MNPQDLSDQIKAAAYRLNFDLIGVTTPDPPQHWETFASWLAAGQHGEMAYLATAHSRQRRADPRQILPECLSILVLGMRYQAPHGLSTTISMPGSGKVASYAWGSDYHDLLPERMQKLAASIDELTGEPVAYRCYTDSGPLLERDLAQRAGLGWIGKNTCLIHPKVGSYFFLAEILLGIDLPPDPPFLHDRCGSCQRCVDACPTGCILPDRTLDARRCIAYLTIELKDSIPVELRPLIGEWVFGCDICQQACPWNQRLTTRAEPPDDAFALRPGVPSPDLVAELEMDQLAFNRKFRGSPVKRTKRRGYLRNVAIALGNALVAGADLPHADSILEHVSLADPEPLVREHAAWALNNTGRG